MADGASKNPSTALRAVPLPVKARGGSTETKRQGPRRPEVRRAENAAFLRALARTGNAKASAAAAGVPQETMHRRRRKDADFAARWDAALKTSARALAAGHAGESPTSMPEGAPGVLRTEGAEAVVRTGIGGRMQLRRARPGGLTRAAVDSFLAHLAATGNVTASAAATGFHSSPFYALADRDEDFRKAWHEALSLAADRLQQLLIHSYVGPIGDEWLDGVSEELPAVSADEALRLLRYHHEILRKERTPRRSSVEEESKRLEKILRQYGALPRGDEDWGPGRG